MDFIASRDELAGDDVRVPLNVRVQQRTVVIIRCSRRLVRLVGVGHFEVDTRDRVGCARGCRRNVRHPQRYEGGGQDHTGEDDRQAWDSHTLRLPLGRLAGSSVC